jgi:hypothetical protein
MRSTPTGAHLDSVACPTVELCVAVGANDAIRTSTRPASTVPWSRTTLGYHYYQQQGSDDYATPQDYLTSVSCPSAGLCVAAPGGGNGLIVSTHPTGGPSAWHLQKLATFPYPLGGLSGPKSRSGPQDIGAVSCPTVTLCVAENIYGELATSTDPQKGTWAPTRLEADPDNTVDADAVACPSAGLCLAAGTYSSIWSSTRPTGGARAWHQVSLGGSKIISIACRSTTLCLASDATNQVFATTDPTGPASSWHPVTLTPTTGTVPSRILSAVACAPGGPCLASADNGQVFATTTG